MQLEDQGATPEVDTLITQDDAPKSMDDTIRDTLRGLQSPEDSHAGEVQSDLTPAGAKEDPEAAAQRLRDAQGKFAAKPTEGDQSAVIDTAAQAEQSDPAPNTWKKEVAAHWAKLPPEVRAEVQRREQDMHRGIEQYKSAAGFGQSIERILAPYQQTMQQLGVKPEQIINDFLVADSTLRHGTAQQKTAYFSQLVHNYGIDLGQLAQLHGSIDPNMYALQNQNQQLQSQLQNYQQTQQQQAEESLNSEISTFAADPSHSHFEAVRGHMSALLQAGQAKDLADAYEQAIYANPTTRAAVLQQQAAAQRDEATKKAQAAKAAASVNHRSRPAMPVATPVGTMDDTIRATLRRLQGA